MATRFQLDHRFRRINADPSASLEIANETPPA